jgi:putative ABC transport system ATP-binding protein
MPVRQYYSRRSVCKTVPVTNQTNCLVDEPTGNLDSKTSDVIMNPLQALNRDGQTTVIVTHEPGIAEFARRQIFMQDGLIKNEGGND